MNSQAYKLNDFFQKEISENPLPSGEKFQRLGQFDLDKLHDDYQKWNSSHATTSLSLNKDELVHMFELHINSLNEHNPEFIMKRRRVQLKNEIGEMMKEKLREYGIVSDLYMKPYSYFPEFDHAKVLQFNPSGELWEYFKTPHQVKSYDKPKDINGKTIKMISVPALVLHYFRDVLEFANRRRIELGITKPEETYYLFIYSLIDDSFNDKLIAELRQNITHDRYNELESYVYSQFMNGVKLWSEEIHGNIEFWSGIETTSEERYLLNIIHEGRNTPRLKREMYYFYPEYD